MRHGRGRASTREQAAAAERGHQRGAPYGEAGRGRGRDGPARRDAGDGGAGARRPPAGRVTRWRPRGRGGEPHREAHRGARRVTGQWARGRLEKTGEEEGEEAAVRRCGPDERRGRIRGDVGRRACGEGGAGVLGDWSGRRGGRGGVVWRWGRRRPAGQHRAASASSPRSRSRSGGGAGDAGGGRVGRVGCGLGFGRVWTEGIRGVRGPGGPLGRPAGPFGPVGQGGFLSLYLFCLFSFLIFPFLF